MTPLSIKCLIAVTLKEWGMFCIGAVRVVNPKELPFHANHAFACPVQKSMPTVGLIS